MCIFLNKFRYTGTPALQSLVANNFVNSHLKKRQNTVNLHHYSSVAESLRIRLTQKLRRQNGREAQTDAGNPDHDENHQDVHVGALLHEQNERRTQVSAPQNPNESLTNQTAIFLYVQGGN